MTAKTKMMNRLMSILLCLAMLMTYFPASGLTAMAADGDPVRVADPSTLDSWKTFFPTDNPTTENAGAVWTDKSVFTDASAFTGTGITMKDNDSFLVALSAMASNMTVTGRSAVPTDTMLVLDVSGSMNDGDNDVAEGLVDATNDSIKALLDANKDNRVGVVLYSGASASATNNDAAVLMLPLGRYTITDAEGGYLTYTRTGWGYNTTETISLNSNVVIEGTQNSPGEVEKEVVGATYIQKGIILAMEQFAAENNETTITDDAGNVVTRKPIMVLMSDGAPTLSTSEFTEPGQYNLGTGSSTSAEQGFVTQLSAAYAKQQIETKYKTDCLFYTLGLGTGTDNIATSVLNPASSTNAINNFWTRYNTATVGGTVVVEAADEWWEDDIAVTKIAGTLEQNYVDQYFEVDANSGNLAEGLLDAFEDIIADISLRSKDYPTLISDNEEVSGYISFVDKIGEYMTVTDIKGIMIHDTLFSGADLSSNFVSGGGNLGTYDNPTDLGNELVWAVQQRLGIENVDIARTLLGNAYQYSQLSYTSDTEFSNYIGWYANAAGEFLGFYHEGVTVLPEATGDPEKDPAYTMKSYGYLGEVDEEHGVTASDMMYATVQVRKDIATGEETVEFAIPAALLPIITYEVSLDENGALTGIATSGATAPMRLVYEVALQEGINKYTLKDKVSAEYLNNNTENGSVNFYSNQWMPLVTDGGDYNRTTTNTYAYFNPSRQNDRYYYLEDTLIYVNETGTPYTGNDAPTSTDTMYYGYEVYIKDGGNLDTKTVYRQISSDVLKDAKKGTDDSYWYIPAGSAHVNLHQAYDLYKGGNSVYEAEDNKTGTINYASYPVIDPSRYVETGDGNNYFVASVLGNNGRITLASETGISITKTLAAGVDPTEAAGDVFTFELTNTSNGNDNNEYGALRVSATGVQEDTTVQFTDGKATVELAAGETIYIGGMNENDKIQIVENETEKYILESVSIDGNESSSPAEVTITADTIRSAEFVNDNRGTGNLIIAKEIEHNLGTDYEIPANKSFEITVTLSGIGTAGETFTAKHTGNNAITEIETDANGQFKVTLKHDERIELFGLPEGTVAVVTEPDPGTGFTAQYWVNDVLQVQNNGTVTVRDGVTELVLVENVYNPTYQDVSPVNIEVSGTKYFVDENNSTITNWDNYEFTVVLERDYVDGTSEWSPVGDPIKLNDTNRSFKFDLSAEKYNEPGIYAYQVYEPESIDVDKQIEGIFYDNAWYTFYVEVSDTDMNGTLEIIRVHNDDTGVDIDQTGGVWTVDEINFTNVRYADNNPVPVTATIDVQKNLTNNSGSPEVSLAGYEFGLYTSIQCTTLVKDATIDGVQQVNARETDSVGEGWIDVILTKARTYEFYLKEIEGANDYMTYDPKVVKVTIEVKADVNGALSVDTVRYVDANTSTNLGTNEEELVFTNIYDPTDTELPIDFVRKLLSGRDLRTGEFEFAVQRLVETDGETKVETVLTGTNADDADGDGAADVKFIDPLTFNAVGTYYYRIVETSEDGNGITTDNTTHVIRVVVTDVNGQLQTSHVLESVTGDTITFQNTYRAASVTHAISGNKVLDGRVLLDDEFTFVMTEANENGIAIGGGTNYVAHNTQDGKFTFPEITYTEPGTHYYVVWEEETSGGNFGIHYDDTQYLVTVTITDNNEGSLIATPSYKIINGEDNVPLSFTNEYIPASTSVTITGNKTLIGKNLEEVDAFSFELYESDVNWATGKLVETVKNDKDGTIKFTAIEHKKVGDYYYLVKEVNGGKVIDSIAYDDTVYRVRVEVTDELLGQLDHKVHIYNDADIPQDSITFVNSYPSIGIDITAHKTVENKGSEKIGPEGFEFKLENITDNVSQTSEPLTQKSDANGKAVFTLIFGQDDVGNTYRYKLTEINDNQAHVTYDTKEYEITITISMVDNNLVATQTLNETEVESVVAEFKNVYDYTPDPEDPEDPKDPEDPEDPYDPENPGGHDGDTPIDDPNDPDNPNDPNSPKTGDQTNLGLWFVLLLIGAVIIAFAVYNRKNRKDI